MTKAKLRTFAFYGIGLVVAIIILMGQPYWLAAAVFAALMAATFTLIRD